MADQWLMATNAALAIARRHLVAAAEAQNQEIIKRDRPSSYLRLIDGVAAATEVAFRAYAVVRAGQAIYRTTTRITYRYEYMDEVVQFAIKTLRSRSPVGSGDDPHAGLYRDGHLVFIDGHLVQNAKAWQPGQQIFISNAVPYSRKIEAGRMKMRVPPHVYEDAVPIIAGRFGNGVAIKFVYMPVRFGDGSAWAAFTKLQRTGRKLSEKARADWLVRQPALQITAR
jgi:hypothetical protein